MKQVQATTDDEKSWKKLLALDAEYKKKANPFIKPLKEGDSLNHEKLIRNTFHLIDLHNEFLSKVKHDSSLMQSSGTHAPNGERILADFDFHVVITGNMLKAQLLQTTLPGQTALPNKTNKTERLKPQTIEDLFSDNEKSKYRERLDVLKNVKPALVDENYKYIGGNREKGSIQAFLDAMKNKGIIKRCYAHVDEVNIICQTIGHKINEKTLRNAAGSTGYRKYYQQFLHLL